MSATGAAAAASAADTAPDVPWTLRLRAGVAEVFGRVAVDPVSAWPLAIGRIILGLTTLVWTLTLMPDATALLGSDAIVSVDGASEFFRWIPLDSTGSVWAALIALTVSSIAVTVGFRPTVFLAVSFVLIMALQRRNPAILNSGDIILRDLTLLFAFCPTGAACSLDRYRRVGRDRCWTAPRVAPWGLRLVQLQVSMVYLFAFWSKSGELWREGVAVSTALRLRDLQRFGQIDAIVDSVVLMAMLTWGTLVVEMLLGVLLWVRRLRPALVVVALLLHLSIDVFLLVGFFGPVLAAGLMSFVDGDAVQHRVDRRIARRRRSARAAD
ncbi:MAG: HTTM domain-containing protein [Actinomycetota bacterium]